MRREATVSVFPVPPLFTERPDSRPSWLSAEATAQSPEVSGREDHGERPLEDLSLKRSEPGGDAPPSMGTRRMARHLSCRELFEPGCGPAATLPPEGWRANLALRVLNAGGQRQPCRHQKSRRGRAGEGRRSNPPSRPPRGPHGLCGPAGLWRKARHRDPSRQ